MRTSIWHDWCNPKEFIATHASETGIDYLTLVERILWRQWSSHRSDLIKIMEEAAANILWDKAHEEAIEKQNYTGDKFDPDLSLKELAQRVRADIKEQYPDIRATVRTERFSGGRSLHVTVRSYPPDTDQEQLYFCLREILRSYNYDKGDHWTDYSCSNFFGIVKILDSQGLSLPQPLGE